MNLPVLNPLKADAKTVQNPPVICDIETWGLDARPRAFAMGVVLDELERKRFIDRDAMRDFLLSKRYRGRQIYAHNGGAYDYLSIFGNLFKFFGGGSVCMVNGRFIEARYERQKSVWKFRDSLNLLPASVDDIGKKLGFPKGITPEKFKLGDRSQGVTEEDFVYCERDCEIIFKALTELQKVTGELRATIPSTALATFRRHHMSAPIWVERGLDGRFHDAYFGGRVEAYRIGRLSAPVHVYDYNSLYPFAMITGNYPDPSRLLREREPSVRALLAHLPFREGMASIRVRHEPTYIGYLPRKLDNGKLVFPVGEFWGSWCYPEIRYALSTGRVQVLQVREMVDSAPIPTPFYSYVNLYYEAKKKADGYLRDIYKLLLNGLYGKWAESHHEREIYAEHFDPKVYSEYEEKYPAVRWAPMSKFREDGYYVLTEADAITSHTIYSWASYITSNARVANATIQDVLRKCGHEVVYTDTDSFFSSSLIAATGDLSYMVGEELGQLKLEDKKIEEIFGAKDYRLVGGGFRLKGVRKNAKKLSENDYEQSGVVKLKAALRRGIEPGSPYVVRKHLKRLYDKREVLSDGETKPLYMVEE